MIRHSVERMLDGATPDPSEIWEDTETAVAEAIAATAPRSAPLEVSDLSTFRCGGVWFGLSVELVEGIAAHAVTERLPGTATGVLGVARYRNSIITVVDASVPLGTGPVDLDEANNLVIRHEGGLVALAVDEVGPLIVVGDGTWHTPPPGSGLGGTGIVALVDAGERMVAVLDGLRL